MAISILYLHRDFSKEVHHGKVFSMNDMGPMGPGPKWARAQMGPGPQWAQGPHGPRAQVGPGPKWAQGPSGPGAHPNPIWIWIYRIWDSTRYRVVRGGDSASDSASSVTAQKAVQHL